MPNQGVISDIERSLNFADQLLATDPIYLIVNPMISKRVEIMKTLNRNYVAHEYVNRNWEPMAFSKMAAWLASSKLSFACSAEYLDHIDQVNITNIQKNFLNEIPESTFRETVRDFVVNQQFRKDYWIKGGIKSNALDKIEFLRKQKIMLTKNDKLFDFKVKTSMGEIIVQESVYRPLLDLISDYRPYTLGQLEKSLKSTNLTLMQLTNAMLLFGASGVISPVQDEDQIVRAKPQTDKLNNYIIKRARGSDDVAYLASPVTGGGISVDRFQQLFIFYYGV